MKRVTVVIPPDYVGRVLAEVAEHATEIHVTDNIVEEPSLDLGAPTVAELRKARKPKKEKYRWKGSPRVRNSVLAYTSNGLEVGKEEITQIAKASGIGESAVRQTLRALASEGLLRTTGTRKTGFTYHQAREEAA